MAKPINIAEEASPTLAMDPKKFILWLFIVSIVMIFASLTSAYIVRQAEGNWLQFDLPSMFYVSSGIIVLSSITMHLAYMAAKKDNFSGLKLAMFFTTFLGIAFLYAQYESWKQLVDMGVYFVGNPSGSFMYVISGVHGFHLISGVIFLIIVLISSFKDMVHAKNLRRIEMCATYWHFLGGLWLYLFIFFLLNH
jgi:cytochrome c oxidase subunit III